MRSVLSSFRTFRSLALGAVLSGGALAATADRAQAQAISVRYETGCGPSTFCGSVQFDIANTTGATLEVNRLTLFATGSAFAFTPVAGGATVFGASDDFGLFGGDATVAAGGGNLVIDFLGGTGFPFTLMAGSAGFLELQLASTPTLTNSAFTFTAERSGNTPLRGSVTAAGASVVPEPSTYVLLASGLGALGLIARRRRA